jgi:hypothetical protein
LGLPALTGRTLGIENSEWINGFSLGRFLITAIIECTSPLDGFCAGQVRATFGSRVVAWLGYDP